jgi:DMSO/TMAO reductase YedYZ molybdopterin-dependent catalytic subunit
MPSAWRSKDDELEEDSASVLLALFLFPERQPTWRMAMRERRQFLKTALGVLAGAGVYFTSFHSFLRPLWGEERKIILPKGTKRESLAQRNPGNLDSRNLDITPLKDFQTMGMTEYKVDLEKWRLEVTGRVKRPLVLTYSQVMALPSREKRVLLICPGFFSNHGLWKGILMEGLLRNAEAENGASYITFTSPEGGYERTEKFSMEEILSGKVFLAWGVNGEALPEKHGFPLRVVAEGQDGSRWTKYVGKVRVK